MHKIPCATCARRGYGGICPTGVYAGVRSFAITENHPGIVTKAGGFRKRSRGRHDTHISPMAEPEAQSSEPQQIDDPPSRTIQPDNSWTKLKLMSERIRALEDALQIEYATRQALERMLVSQRNSLDGKHDTADSSKMQDVFQSNDAANTGPRETLSNLNSVNNDRIHPLLTPNLLNIKKVVELHASAQSNTEVGNTDDIPDGESTTDMISAFGMLSIRDGHTVRFMGASAAEVCLSMQTIPSGADIYL